ncbi:hypothetical protein ABES25_10070 [Bacillus gobiensis]|uniref:hypothetical protein n=1 Tax=Bacillus gobiensis TaxID=1441095 RepID=UPI003D2108D2
MSESKQNKSQQDQPECTVIYLNEPNFDLMAKGFMILFEEMEKLEKESGFKCPKRKK